MQLSKQSPVFQSIFWPVDLELHRYGCLNYLKLFCLYYVEFNIQNMSEKLKLAELNLAMKHLSPHRDNRPFQNCDKERGNLAVGVFLVFHMDSTRHSRHQMT